MRYEQYPTGCFGGYVERQQRLEYKTVIKIRNAMRKFTQWRWISEPIQVIVPFDFYLDILNMDLRSKFFMRLINGWGDDCNTF